jgi:hypothetical protein
VVRTIAPHSESDSAALLLQFLAYFGAVAGRQPYYQIEATKHHANIFVCLVGETARGRKGTAYDHIEAFFQTADPSWTLDNLCGGCGSGEGLIAAVRDATVKREPIKEKGRVTGYEEVETDAGVQDKRLLVYEAEFSALLKVASREGNILSEILRKAWDTGNLRNTVKTHPLKATGAHIALIGHITVDELQKTLTTTDMGNGFANRFLWEYVRRSKLLPDGGAFQNVNVQPLVERLRRTCVTARAIGQMSRDADATTAWQAVYPALTEDRPGLVGSLLARAEAQALRLSMLYTLLDGTAVIRLEHLQAALALWGYLEASVLYIFGTSTGHPTADTLLAALEEQAPKGLSRTDILTKVFQGNLRRDALERVLRLLQQRERITLQKHSPKGGKGRPKEVVYFRQYEFNECNGFNPGRYVSLSNNAVKAMGLNSYDARTKYEFNPETPTGSADVGEPEPDTAASPPEAYEEVTI